jgi:DNA-binding NarL/FixJ family response regulator
MELIARGWTSKEIAASLFIAENTVKQHRKHVAAKLGLHCSAELVVCAAARLTGTCRITSAANLEKSGAGA